MRFLDFVLFVLLVAALTAGLYLLWLYYPTENADFEKYSANSDVSNLSNVSGQFYQNMRYPSNRISYLLSDECSRKKVEDFEQAVAILEDRTILDFYRSDNPEIIISCSNISPTPGEEGHFIAGEGGPSEIINATKYSVILSGKISLYRPETCPKPQVSLHELLHAIGYDHNNNQNSIMYPITDCDQELDDYIVDSINSLYSVPEKGDLLIESVDANKTGAYLNLEVVLVNQGIKQISDSVLIISSDGEEVKEFQIGDFAIGTRRFLTATNVRVPRNAVSILLEIRSTEDELSKENNFASVRKLESQ